MENHIMTLNRRQFLQALTAGAAGAAAGVLAHADTTGAETPPAARKPNIVIILADDLGFNDVSYHGSEIRTPNIDRIVRKGVELDRFYVEPLCSPTRAGLITGRHPLRMGIGCTVITPWRKHGLPDDERTIPEVLAGAGYKRRGCFGKWHLGHSNVKYHPLNRGFTYYYGCYNGAIDYFTHVREGELDWHRNHRPAREEGYTTTLLTNEVVKFIDGSPTDEPFFVYVPYNAPHAPLEAPQEYIDKYPNLAGKRRTYAAMVAALDEGVGKILAALADKGVADNTFVWFISDNGGGIGSDNAPLRGRKATVFEGGIRVPAAAYWPKGGVTGGRKVSAVMGLIDVMPTVMRLSGVKDSKGKPLDGIDVLDLMTGKAKKAPDRPWFAYIGYGEKDQLAVIDGPWKLIYVGPRILKAKDPITDGEIHLFKINEDPNETTDLAADNGEVVRKLLAKLKAYRSWHGPTCLLDEPSKRPKDFKAPKDWILPGTKPEDLKETGNK